MDQPILLGNSPSTEALRRQIEFAARSNAKVLIVGETGAGKEVVARAIHERSARRARPFVAINCSGIPDTLLESELFGHARGSFTGAYRDKQGLIRQAQGGTLFLDELGEMGLRMQSVLLRFAESGELQTVGSDGPSTASDVRLICATNRDLHAAMENGAFRRDLYYRLNVVEIRVMALRERRLDIPVLLGHFLQRAADAHARPSPELSRRRFEVIPELAIEAGYVLVTGGRRDVLDAEMRRLEQPCRRIHPGQLQVLVVAEAGLAKHQTAQV